MHWQMLISMAAEYRCERIKCDANLHFFNCHTLCTRIRGPWGVLSASLRSASVLTACSVFGVACGEPIFRYGNCFSGALIRRSSRELPCALACTASRRCEIMAAIRTLVHL